MRPNISSCHSLPWTLIVFEWPDGSGKSTQIKTLKKLLEAERKLVTVSEWKSAPVLSSFMFQNESLNKFADRILPETSLFMQMADLLYRIEREVIPALKQWHIVLLDRWIQTLMVRWYMIWMTETQIREWLLWWRNSIYKELFDNAQTIYFSIDMAESLKRLQARTIKQQKEYIGKKFSKAKYDGTLLALHMTNSLVYAPDGKKMTRHDKKLFVRNTQEQIIQTYIRVFQDETWKYSEINWMQTKKELTEILKKRIVDMIV